MSFEARITIDEVSIKYIIKHIPKPQKRQMYIHKPEDMKKFLDVISDGKEYEIFFVKAAFSREF